MLVNFSERELEVIRDLAKMLEISEEKLVIHAVRVLQLKLTAFKSIDSPGCGLVE